VWYVLQFAIASYIGYQWATLPGNTPDNLGHGLGLGAVVAWFVTAGIVSGYDMCKRYWYNRHLRRARKRRRRQLKKLIRYYYRDQRVSKGERLLLVLRGGHFPRLRKRQPKKDLRVIGFVRPQIARSNLISKK
jgi:hypothetical protein